MNMEIGVLRLSLSFMNIHKEFLVTSCDARGEPSRFGT